MRAPSIKTMQKYWTLLHLKADGSYQPRSIPTAQAFCETQLSTWADLDDRQIQSNLFQSSDPQAQLCLRCYISHEILQVCTSLVNQFGHTYAFQVRDLFPLVLDDDGQLNTSYQPLSQRILQNFNPTAGSLRNWVTRFVRQDPAVRDFLLGQGLHLISDWAILNDTSPTSLRRIFGEFYSLTAQETDTAIQLLNSYQLIYLPSRRQQNGRQRCAPPTDDQLDRIAQHFHQSTGTLLTPRNALTQLLNIAQKLRQYRIHRRGGKNPRTPLEVSLDIPETAEQLEYEVSSQVLEDRLDSQQATTFITTYRQQLLTALDQALSQVIQDRQAKQPKKAQAFLLALERFHCQHQSMGDIAKAIGAKRQDEISRLLQLKAFRTDVRHLMLRALKAFAQDQASLYNDPDQLLALDEAIEAAIAEQLDALMSAAEREAATAKGYITPSVFSDRLCTYLHRIIDDP